MCDTERREGACWPTPCHCHCTKAQGVSDRFCVRARSARNFIWRALGSPKRARVDLLKGMVHAHAQSDGLRYRVPDRLIDSPVMTIARLFPHSLLAALAILSFTVVPHGRGDASTENECPCFWPILHLQLASLPPSPTKTDNATVATFLRPPERTNDKSFCPSVCEARTRAARR